jgi:rubrerythrin
MTRIIEVSSAAYQEIRAALALADIDDQIVLEDAEELLYLDAIALKERTRRSRATCATCGNIWDLAAQLKKCPNCGAGRTASGEG